MGCIKCGRKGLTAAARLMKNPCEFEAQGKYWVCKKCNRKANRKYNIPPMANCKVTAESK